MLLQCILFFHSVIFLFELCFKLRYLVCLFSFSRQIDSLTSDFVVPLHLVCLGTKRDVFFFILHLLVAVHRIIIVCLFCNIAKTHSCAAEMVSRILVGVEVNTTFLKYWHGSLVYYFCILSAFHELITIFLNST